MPLLVTTLLFRDAAGFVVLGAAAGVFGFLHGRATYAADVLLGKIVF
jgi:hypothetical protein